MWMLLHLFPIKTQPHQAPLSPLSWLLPFPPPQITIARLLGPLWPHVFSKFIFMSFKISLLFDTFPVQPFFLLQFALLTNPEHLTYRIWHRNRLCILYKLEAGPTSLVRLIFDPFCQIVEFFYQEAWNVWLSFFVLSGCWSAMPRSIIPFEVAKWWYSLFHLLVNVKRKFY